jgi:hypothetical protein
MNRQERKTPPGGNPAARYSRERLSSGFQPIVALAVLPLIDGESKKRDRRSLRRLSHGALLNARLNPAGRRIVGTRFTG